MRRALLVLLACAVLLAAASATGCGGTCMDTESKYPWGDSPDPYPGGKCGPQATPMATTSARP